MVLPPDILKHMAADLGMLPSQLASVIRTAPLRYKVFPIKKRDGTPRLVAQPAREVKAVQRWLIRELRQYLPIHSAVMAYEPGTSIKKNAELHARSRYILKMDFTGFFPSITAEDIRRHLERHCPDNYTLPERNLIVRACTWLPTRLAPLQLCIGAPSSPLLSNSIMYDFDCAIADRAEKDDVMYTRYADDLTFSCREKGLLSDYTDLVGNVLSELSYPRIAINRSKTVHASRAGHRMVTGVVLTPEGKLSVGRERKREVRAMYHRRTLGLLSAKEQEVLDGLLAFVDDIEPGFSAKLKSRSGGHP